MCSRGRSAVEQRTGLLQILQLQVPIKYALENQLTMLGITLTSDILTVVVHINPLFNHFKERVEIYY